METQPLIVVVGPTASGKTAMAINIAKQFDGEIICADSRTVYKGMDIGTAKPTESEQSEVKHWGLDLVEPNERFTVADFKRYADERIADIRMRGKVPLLVGGSGLYVDSVIFDYQFGLDADGDTRSKFMEMTLDQLYDYCTEHNVVLPENYKNKRYVIRAIEQGTINNKRRPQPINNCNIVGIATETDVLKTRIAQRAEQIFDEGVVDEATRLGGVYGWEYESMTGNIYPLCRQYIQGTLTFSEMKERFIVLDWRLAKRQLTWLRRNEYIKWYNAQDAERYIAGLLESEH